MQAEALPVKGKSILSLQGIRAITCFLIYIYHATHLRPLGQWGVSVFFVLSGFVMTLSYWERPIKPTVEDAVAFSLRKIKRLFALHVIMLLCGLLREVLTTENSWPDYAVKLLLTIPLLQTWTPKHYQALNSVDWYLSATLFLYAAFPFLLAFLRRKRLGAKPALLWMFAVFCVQLLVGAAVGRFLPEHTKWLTYCLPLYRLGDFFVGCLLGSLFRSRGEARLSKAAATAQEGAIVLAIVLSCFAYQTVLKPYDWFTYTALFLPTSAGLIYVFAREEGLFSKLLVNRYTLAFAALSAYFFLIHRQLLYFVALGFERLFGIDLNPWLLAVVAFPITLLLVKSYAAVHEKLGRKA